MEENTQKWYTELMSGPIQPTGGGGGPRWPNHNVTAAGGAGGGDGPKKPDILRREKTDDTLDINPEREVARLITQSSLYGVENEQRFLQTPEHVFTMLLALPTLSVEQRAQVQTTYERWKTLQRLHGTLYPLPIQPVPPVEPVGDREAEPDLPQKKQPDEDDATKEH